MFAEKAKKVHSDKYDYSLVEYKSAKTKVKIICNKHGVFEQTPSNHLSGKGCRFCAKNVLRVDCKIRDANLISIWYCYKTTYGAVYPWELRF